MGTHHGTTAMKTIIALATATLVSGFGSMKAATPCPCTGNKGASDGSSFSVDIGESCAAWDGMESYCKEGGSSFGSDWCEDDWCYVDASCSQPTYSSSYFPGTELYFSYKSCDADFMGNSWVGLCECTGNKGASDGSSYGVNMGGANVGLEDVRGCKPWDGLEQY